MASSPANQRRETSQDASGKECDASVVEQGILLQTKVNTVSAIEYMKNRGISPAVIQRELSGFHAASARKQALAEHARQE